MDAKADRAPQQIDPFGQQRSTWLMQRFTMKKALPPAVRKQR